MALRHAAVRRVLAVAWIQGDVIGAYDPFTSEGGPENSSVARHRKLGECLARHTGDRIEGISLALLVDDIVEKRPERGARKFGGGIGNHLNRALQIEFCGNCRADLVESSRICASSCMTRAFARVFAKLDVGCNPRPQLTRAERLDQIIVGAFPQAFDLGFFARARRKHNHRHGAQGWIVAQLLQ